MEAPMKLSKRIITMIVIAFAIAISLLYIISKTILLKDFIDLEIKKTDSGIARIVKSIENDTDTLDALALDYSHWDDTYYFVQNHNTNYIESNFNDLTAFNRLDVNFVIISDKDGNLVFSKSLNCTDNQKLSDNDKSLISKNIYNLMKYNKTNSVKGLYMTDKGPLMLSTQPIINSNEDAAPNGIFIVAKYLDRGEMDLISSIIGINFDIQTYNSMDYKYATLDSDESVFINNNDSKLITGYKAINDIFNAPAISVKLSLPKDILLEANTSVDFFIILMVTICFLLILIVITFLNSIILKRISYIKNTVDKIGHTEDLSLRLYDNKNDEISELSDKFNIMFDQLQSSNIKLLKSEKKYSSLFSNMMSCFMYAKVTLDANSRPNNFIILEVNNSFAHLFNHTNDNVINKLGLQFLPNELSNHSNFMKMITDVAINGSTSKADAFYFEKYDTWFYLTIYSSEKYHFAMMLTDITDKRNSEQKMINLAYFDELTNLPNRKKLLEDIQKIVDSGDEKFALLFIDLDNFKGINDSLGHEVGDYVLEKTALRLKHLVEDNTMVGRLGGDEFIIVLRNLKHISEAETLASRIYSLLKPVIIYKGSELYVGASIGISLYPNDGTNLSQLLRNADAAMYAAKRNGGYCYEIYSRNMNDYALTELIMESNLRKALDNNEIILYYQPIVDLKTMITIGAEALTRWKQKDILVPPDQFIPLAKNIGEIANIDNWVLRNACLQCKIWGQYTSKDFFVSINISYKQLKEPNFIKTVINAYEDSCLDPRFINLEITEDEAMEDVELTIKVLKKLKAKGITVSLDDFGTGYSSLSYVNKLPIDLLKIDMSLISTLDIDEKTIEIVRTIIVMSHSLGIKVLAEGVERESQLEILKEFNCDKVQGYIVSMPIPPKEFEAKFF